MAQAVSLQLLYSKLNCHKDTVSSDYLCCRSCAAELQGLSWARLSLLTVGKTFLGGEKSACTQQLQTIMCSVWSAIKVEVMRYCLIFLSIRGRFQCLTCLLVPSQVCECVQLQIRNSSIPSKQKQSVEKLGFFWWKCHSIGLEVIMRICTGYIFIISDPKL